MDHRKDRQRYHELRMLRFVAYDEHRDEHSGRTSEQTEKKQSLFRDSSVFQFRGDFVVYGDDDGDDRYDRQIAEYNVQDGVHGIVSF